VPLVYLPGRAGLDLDLSLVYNSLVWTKSADGSSVRFNADRGFPAPGFRLGYPTLQQLYTDAETGAPAYMLVTSSGRKVELRWRGEAGAFKSYDNCNIRLIENYLNLGFNLLWTPDGAAYFDLK
jgi:hypothetical protein